MAEGKHGTIGQRNENSDEKSFLDCNCFARGILLLNREALQTCIKSLSCSRRVERSTKALINWENEVEVSLPESKKLCTQFLSSPLHDLDNLKKRKISADELTD